MLSRVFTLLPPKRPLWTSHLHKWYKFYLDGFLNGFDHFKMLKIVLTRTHWPWTLSFFDREIVAPWLRSVNPAGEHGAWCKSNTIFKQFSSIWKGWNLGKECEETSGSVILNPRLRNCFISLRAVFCICRNTRVTFCSKVYFFICECWIMTCTYIILYITLYDPVGLVMQSYPDVVSSKSLTAQPNPSSIYTLKDFCVDISYIIHTFLYIL